MVSEPVKPPRPVSCGSTRWSVFAEHPGEEAPWQILEQFLEMQGAKDKVVSCSQIQIETRMVLTDGLPISLSLESTFSTNYCSM